MLPKCTYLWECKVNEETSLYEYSNESIEVNAYLIQWWDEKSSYELLCLYARIQLPWCMSWM